MKAESLSTIRHPEVRAKRASKDAGRGAGAVAPPKSGLPDFGFSSVQVGNCRLGWLGAIRRAPQGDGTGSHRAGDPLLELLLRRGADLARGELAVLEQHQGRDRHDAVFGGRARILVNIEL